GLLHSGPGSPDRIGAALGPSGTIEFEHAMLGHVGHLQLAVADLNGDFFVGPRSLLRIEEVEDELTALQAIPVLGNRAEAVVESAIRRKLEQDTDNTARTLLCIP